MPYIGEIRLFAGNFEPNGWRFCNGQLIAISENDPLFTLLGTTYGGDGRVNFALPDLRARVPVYVGGTSSFTLGERGGESAHTISASETPQHIHVMQATTAAATTNIAVGALLASSSSGAYNSPGAGGLTTLIPAEVTNVGGSQAHQNMMPFLTLSFCIALQGIFPSQT